MTVVLGLDLSLTRTGIARITAGDVPTWWTGSIKSAGEKGATLRDRHARMSRLAFSIRGEVIDSRPSLVVIEGPALARVGGSNHDRSGLWWLVVEPLMTAQVPVAVCPPKSRAKYVTGNGNAGKDEVLLAAASRYPHAGISNNDEADALVLAAMGARHLGEPVESSLPKTHLAALPGVEWPH